MIDEIINWVDKDLKKINSTKIFKRYFEGLLIEEIGESNHLTNEVEGIGLVMDKTFLITSIHLYSGYNEVGIFRDRLPFDLEFSFSMNEIHSILGKPVKSGGGQTILHMGYINCWDKYYLNGFSIHFQYSFNNSCIELVTIASLQLEQYFNSSLK